MTGILFTNPIRPNRLNHGSFVKDVIRYHCVPLLAKPNTYVDSQLDRTARTASPIMSAYEGPGNIFYRLISRGQLSYHEVL